MTILSVSDIRLEYGTDIILQKILISQKNNINDIDIVRKKDYNIIIKGKEVCCYVHICF